MKKKYRNLGKTTIFTKLTQPTRDSGRPDHLSKSNLHLSRREMFGEKSINWISHIHPQVFKSVCSIFEREKRQGYIFGQRVDGKKFALVEVKFIA